MHRTPVPKECIDVPLVLNVLIDHPCNAHGHNSVVPRGDEHQRQTHAHAEEGQCPVGETHSLKLPVFIYQTWLCCLHIYTTHCCFIRSTTEHNRNSLVTVKRMI